MNTALWIAQIILALLFLMVGIMKVMLPYEKVVARTPYAEDFSPGTIRLIGILEILGALGLILPTVTGILPWLTPLAAVGLALVMVGAIIVHVRRKEYSLIIVNVIFLLLAIFVAYGRF